MATDHLVPDWRAVSKRYVRGDAYAYERFCGMLLGRRALDTEGLAMVGDRLVEWPGHS